MYANQFEEQVSLKLLVNKETNRVLFAEAGKDFVDVLCSFLTLPLGTIVRLVRQQSIVKPVTVGCLNSLYKSVENLHNERLWTATCNEMLLQPRNSSEDYCRSIKLNIDDTQPKMYFICTNFVDCKYRCISTFNNQTCGYGKPLTRSVSLVRDNDCNGFVNGGATFIITDDLIVMPNSMDTSFGLLQRFAIENTNSVKEMTVHVTKKKVVDLLKCCLFSKSTLTDLFLEKKPFLMMASFLPCNVAITGSIQIKLKLFIRKSDGKILFAQGEQDFADFLFSFLTLPLGRVVSMLRENCSLGSVDGLYNSIVNLDGYKYLMSNEVKNRLVYPQVAAQFKISNQILEISETQAPQYYCYYQLITRFRESTIGTCSITTYYRNFDAQTESYARLKLVDPKSSTGSHGGYVKGPAVFMATDDLVVAPMSPISVISLLNRLNTTPSDLQEKVVIIGVKEGLNILKAALTSTSALTNGLCHFLMEVKQEK